MRRLRVLIIIILLLFFISCNDKKIMNIQLDDYEVIQDIDEFNIYDLSLVLTYNDGTTNKVYITKDMISDNDLSKLSVSGSHIIKINYLDYEIDLNFKLTNFYEVSFIACDNKISTQRVECGKDAIIPDPVEKEGYIFTGWSHDGKNITEDTIIEAVYEKIKYEVKFIAYDIVIDTQIIEHGKSVNLPELEEKEGYTFTGWTHDGKNITEDTIIEAVYEKIKYEVKLVYDKEEFDTLIVEHGSDAILPIDPIKEGHIFIDWNHDGKNITEDTIIEAIYELEKYEVRFLYDYEVYATQIVEYGDYATPIDPTIKEWEYIKGWSNKLYEPIIKNTDIYVIVDYIEDGRFLEFKYNIKEEITEYLNLTMYALTRDEMNLINSYIDDSSKRIDLAISEKEVYRIANYTKQLIDHMCLKYFDDSFGKIYGGERYTEGSGTYKDPYIIDTKGKLIYFSNTTNNGIGTFAYYELKENIDLQGVKWIPIGRFIGCFNGNGHEITNMEITKFTSESIGLFSINYGIIENLGLKNINIDITCNKKDVMDNGSRLEIGGIVGTNCGQIENCYVIGNVKLTYNGEPKTHGGIPPRLDYIGGISGFCKNDAYNHIGRKISIRNCYTEMSMDINYYNEIVIAHIAGICGVGDDKIEDCLSIVEFSTVYEEPSFEYGGGCKIRPIGVKFINSYYYGSNHSTDKCSLNDLNMDEFYYEVLGWDEYIWDLSNVIFKDGKFLDDCYPKLKNKG